MIKFRMLAVFVGCDSQDIAKLSKPSTMNQDTSLAYFGSLEGNEKTKDLQIG